MHSTLDVAMAIENAADEVVYDAARGIAQIDNWRERLSEAARKLDVSPKVVLDEIGQRHHELQHYGAGILGSIPEEVREGLGLS